MSEANPAKAAADASAAELVGKGLSNLAGTTTAKPNPTTAAAQQAETPAGSAESADAAAKAAADGKEAAAAATAATAAPAPEGFVAKADVEKMIADAMAKQTTQQATMSERDRYIRQKMDDMPLSMQNLMPKTNDLKALNEANLALRDDLKNWIGKEVKAGRIRIPDVNGDSGGTGMSGAIQSQGNYGGRSDTPTDNVMAGLSSGGRVQAAAADESRSVARR